MLRKIAWKNIIHKPLNSALCISLLTFGVGIISVLLLVQHQMEQKFERDLQNVDLVVGAKGSPLQLVLSAIYHLDAPTGNIELAEARKIMDNPMVKSAIPLAYGDSYQGYRILGTTEDYGNKYDVQLSEGRFYSAAMEVTIGANIAQRTGLRLGDTFLGTHGEVKEGHVHENDEYTIVGVLQKTNTVLDNLLLCNIESVWQVHTHQDTEHSPTEALHAPEPDSNHHHEHENEDEHDHADDHPEEKGAADDKKITAVLLEYKSRMSLFNMPRIINEQTNMQAVLPALEINRLFYMIGVGATTVKLIAGGIMAMAGFSVFFVLYNRLRDRKYELALMRSVGYRPQHLFFLLLLEGFFLSALGYTLGWLLSRFGLFLINRQAEGEFNFQFAGEWMTGEIWLLLLTFSVGFLSAILPAVRAMQLDVSDVLSNN